MTARPRRGRLFWPLAWTLVLTDCATKRLAEEGLALAHVPHDVVDGFVRFTLAYNTGGAFSIGFGPYQRWILIAITLGVLAFLARLYRDTARQGRLHVTGLALICGGAVGNLLDRLRSSRGVVDFIDVGIGNARFWTFNVADIGVSLGAVVLAYTLWRHERGQDPNAPAHTDGVES